MTNIFGLFNDFSQTLSATDNDSKYSYNICCKMYEEALIDALIFTSYNYVGLDVSYVSQNNPWATTETVCKLLLSSLGNFRSAPCVLSRVLVVIMIPIENFSKRVHPLSSFLLPSYVNIPIF